MATANQNAQGLVLALFNAAAGGNLANLSPFTATASATNTTASELVAVAALVTGVNLSNNATFASTLLSNLQITSSNPAYANALAWVNGQLAAPGADKGVIAGTAVTYLLSLTDSTNPFYAVASTFQNRVNTAVAYSAGAGASVLSASALIAYQSSVDNYVAPPPPVVTTALTSSSTDVLNGGASGTTFTGVFSNLLSANTLQSTDKIIGVAGAPNVLQISLGATWGGFSSGGLTNVQTVQLTNPGSQAVSWDGTGTAGVTSYALTNTSGTINLTNVASGFNSLTLAGNTNTSVANITTTFVSGAAETTSTTDVLALNLNAVGASATNYANLLLNSFETNNVVLTGANFVSFADASGLKQLNISGSGTATVKYVPSTLTGFDASTSTGALTLGFSTSATTYPTALGTIKVGTGGAAITAYVPTSTTGLLGNATITAAGGTNSLTLVEAAAVSEQYTMSGIQTLTIQNAANPISFSGANVTGLTTIVIPAGLATSAGSTGSLTFGNMGAIPLTFTATGSGTTGVTNSAVSSDNSGTVTLNISAGSTDVTNLTGETQSAAYTFSKTNALTVNINPFAQDTGNISAPLASSVNINVGTGLNGTTEQTLWNSTVTAATATSFNIAATGQLGSSASLVAVKATSGTITDGATAAAGAFVLNAPLLNTLNVTNGSALSFVGSALSGLQSLTVVDTKGLVTLPQLVDANSITLSGAGSTSAVTINSGLGQTSNGYDLSVNATGLASGLTLPAVTVTAGNNVTINASGVTGNVTIGANSTTDTIATSGTRAGNVTISDNGPLSTFVLGNVYATGTVNINASGTASATVGTVAGNSVTINVNGAAAASAVGNITAKSLADVTYPTLASSVSNTITLDTGSTASQVNLHGSLNNDTITVTSNSTTQSSITFAGDLSIGTNTLTVTDNKSGTTAQNINLSALANVTSSTITTGAGNDTIVGSSGNDLIFAGKGTNTLTGGAGQDTFEFNLGDSTILNVNTITDFSNSDNDQIVYAQGNIQLYTTASANSSNVTVSSNSKGVVTFATQTGTSGTAADYATLTQKTTLLHAVAANTAGVSALFQDSGYTYLWIDSGSTYANDTIIKLVGVALPSSTAPTLGANLAAITATGIYGIGL